MEEAQGPAPFRGALTENQIDLAHILVHNGRSDLYNRICNFSDGKAQENFFDQVKRRYLPLRPEQDNLAAYISKGDVTTINPYIDIVEELLIDNPHDGFTPELVPDPDFMKRVVDYLNEMLPLLSYEEKSKSVIFKHAYELHTFYPKLKSRKVKQSNGQGHSTNLLEFHGYIDYVNGRNVYRNYRVFEAPISIRLPLSYPQRRPHVWVNRPDDSSIFPPHLNVAPSGLVSIPYLIDWVEDKSDLVTLVSHLRVDFTSQPPIFPIDLGIDLSPEQKKLLKILVDYGQLYLWEGIQALPANEKIAFFNKVIGRYTGDHKDLAHHIMTTKGGLIGYIKIVAELLGLPRTMRKTEDIANLDFI